MPPIIVNLDSAFDWTEEVRAIWNRLDCKGIGQAIAPQVTAAQWAKRTDELALIALVSSGRIDKGYHFPLGDDDQDQGEEPDDPLTDEWRDRQRCRATNEQENRDEHPTQRPPFSGEEPFFRPPRLGKRGAVDWLGIYVGDAAELLEYWGFLKEGLLTIGGPPNVRFEPGAPAIFLCPENIHRIYPKIASLREEFRHPLSLASNPAIVNLRMVLLHELGHHFFPVHRSGAGRFLSEALANLYCHRGLNREEQVWQLYKTWHLQSPEYSAYRPLTVLSELDADCRTAVARCFEGDLGGWAFETPKNTGDLERRLTASLAMALSADAAPCIGLWCRELRRLVLSKSRGILDWSANRVQFHRHSRDEQIPADLVLDLYGQRDLAPWAMKPGLPRDFWSGWKHGTVRWPADSLHISDNLKAWANVFNNASDKGLKKAAAMAIAKFPARPGKVKNIIKGKNYGFIADDEAGEGDWFFHATGVPAPGFHKLALGDAVHFTLAENPKDPPGGLQAINVTRD